jgi:hypothetical protein
MTPEPDILAKLEQDTTHLQNIAKVLGPFHDALIEVGFTDKEALRLVRDYFGDVIYEMGHPDCDEE